MTFRRACRAWDRFLFSPISPVPLGVYRAFLGTLVLVSGVVLLPDLQLLFGPRGILPMPYALRYMPTPRLNVLAWLPDRPFWLYAFFAVFLLAAACLTVGFLTRLSSILVFVGIVTLHHRNPTLLNSGDTFMRVAAFCLMFAPAGRAFSVDRWLRVRRGVEPPGAPAPGAPAPVAPWAQRLIQIQLSVSYLATLWWKLGGYAWIDGTAVYYATRLQEFGRPPLPYVFDHIWPIKLMTWGTLGVEFALGALVWFRDLRYPVLLAGLLLHLGLDYSMNIPLFQWIMLSAYVLFIDPRDVQRARAWWSTRRAKRSHPPAWSPAVTTE